MMKEVLHIAICDDLESDRNHLINILKATTIPNIYTVFHKGEDFLMDYKIGAFDLVFMDIYMEEMTGIQTITALRKIDREIPVAFTTTSLDHTLESYRLEVLKYIEKPASSSVVNDFLLMALMKKNNVPKLQVKINDSIETIKLSKILFFEQKSSKYTINLVGGEIITCTGKLATVSEQLHSSSFFQCHKSYIVNFDYVKSLQKDLLIFQMEEGDNVHIRRDSFWKTKKAYEDFLFNRTRGGQS